MSTYAQLSDLLAYVSKPLQTSSGQQQQLLDNSEQDVDALFGSGSLTNSLQGVKMSGVTGGSFVLSLDWLGDTYTSLPIPWNASGVTLVGLLNGMTNARGDLIPASPWSKALTPSVAASWAFGPLPGVSVVVEAGGHLGGQTINPLVLAQNNLTGTSPTVVITQLRGGGLRIDPWQIEPAQMWRLKRAVCAQAEYRDEMGEDFFIREQYNSVSGPEFRTQGRLPIIGPKVNRELVGSGLLQYGARAVVSSRGKQAVAYQPVGGTPIPDDWRAV